VPRVRLGGRKPTPSSAVSITVATSTGVGSRNSDRAAAAWRERGAWRDCQMNQPTYCLLTEMSYTASRAGRETADPAADGGPVATLGRGRRIRRRVDRFATVNARRNRGEFRYARAAGCRG
jgi:hypothetical protein